MPAKKKPTGPVPGELDWGEVERVLDLMSRHGLDEFEYSDGSIHVRLKKSGSSNSAATASPAAPPAAVLYPVSAAQATPPVAAAPAEEGEKPHLVKSPIVGTFYSAPSPGAPSFVKIGDHVQAGQVLCIIEAMKLMNEIESDVTGEITRIFVENGQPVEYGEPLFAIRPNAAARRS